MEAKQSQVALGEEGGVGFYWTSGGVGEEGGMGELEVFFEFSTGPVVVASGVGHLQGISLDRMGLVENTWEQKT